jgi:predicted AAA+ superfamily ATPase
MFIRLIYNKLFSRLHEPRQFIQALLGPRQVGKTTLARQIISNLNWPVHYVSADEPGLKSELWLTQQWEQARLLCRQHQGSCLLVLDEIQKIDNWSSLIKQCWDEDTFKQISLYVIVLGSAPWLLQQGLTESLAGRFEIIPVTHWSFAEMRQAFEFSLDEYIYFGGYPGAAPLIHDEERWRRYILDSLIETTVSRDILLMTRVDKPALLRRVFHLGCVYSGQILSYQKMQGQLQDAGNTTTIAHYLELLNHAGMVTGLPKYAGQIVRQRASSPKLQVLNTALLSAQQNHAFLNVQQQADYWGHLVESAVGAYLLNQTAYSSIKVLYWRDGNYEVDFILQRGEELVALEVKSGVKKDTLSGLERFVQLFKPKRYLQIGGNGGMPLEMFLTMEVAELFE